LYAGRICADAGFALAHLYLAQRLGPSGLLALGVAWPLAFGATAWTLALRRFRRGDLV
jgi:hypothetical protein